MKIFNYELRITNKRWRALVLRTVKGFMVLAIFSCQCACLGPRPVLQTAAVEVPAPSYSLYNNDRRPSGLDWWSELNSPELDQLMKLVLPANFTLAEARARLDQARYVARKAGAGLWPELDFGAEAGNLTSKTSGQASHSSDEWSTGLELAYEIDLWGRLKAVKAEALNQYQASAAELEAAALSVSGEVAQVWFELLAKRVHQDLYRRQLKLQEKLLEVIRIRFPLAQATALDFYNQQQLVESLKTKLIPVVKEEEILSRALARLAAVNELKEAGFAGREFPLIGTLPALGLPADLLAARPDVRAAGLQLTAADWAVSAARAERLPALRLALGSGFNGSGFSSLFDNWFASLAGSLTSPLFDAGYRRAEVERVRALAAERLAAYRKIVLTALHEVEDALTRESQAREKLASLEHRLDLSRRTLREARRRYLNGSSDFINVLSEELTSLQLEHDVVDENLNLLLARVALHQALGGGYELRIFNR